MRQTTMRHEEIHAQERDSYIVLIHLYTLTRLAPIDSLPAERIIRDLGFEASRGQEILRQLIWTEHVAYAGSGEGLVLTERAVRYVEREAGRRKSLRILS